MIYFGLDAERTAMDVQQDVSTARRAVEGAQRVPLTATQYRQTVPGTPAAQLPPLPPPVAAHVNACLAAARQQVLQAQAEARQVKAQANAIIGRLQSEVQSLYAIVQRQGAALDVLANQTRETFTTKPGQWTPLVPRGVAEQVNPRASAETLIPQAAQGTPQAVDTTPPAQAAQPGMGEYADVGDVDLTDVAPWELVDDD